MNDVKPWSILMIVGGLVIAASTLLGWAQILLPDGTSVIENAWDKGLLGLYQTIIGLGVAAYGLAQVMQKKTIAGKIAGLTVGQWMIALPAAVAIWGFAFQFDQNPEIGVLTTWVSGVAACAGAAMSERAVVQTQLTNRIPNY